MARIDYWRTKMPYLGSRKLAVQLQKEDGIDVTRKVIRRLMAIMGIHAICPKENLSKRNFMESIVPYRLRNKIVFISNQIWSVDIIYQYASKLYVPDRNYRLVHPSDSRPEPI